MKQEISYYKAIFDTIDQAIFIINADNFEIIDLNQKASVFLKIKNKELENLKFYDISNSKNGYTKDSFIKNIKRNSDTYIFDFDWEIKNLKGELFRVNLNVKKIKCNNAQNILFIIIKNQENELAKKIYLYHTDHIYGTSSEITSKSFLKINPYIHENGPSKAEIYLKLKEADERRQMALEAASDGIWDVNMENGRVYYSPRYFTMLGFDPADFTNKKDVLESLIHPEDYERIIKLFRNFLKSSDDLIEFEMRMIRSDGSYAWIEARGKVFKKNKNGKPVRIVGTQKDITQRKSFENIRNTLFEIANAVNLSRNLDELFLSIQKIIGRLVDTKNCYVALYDELYDTLSLPFHKDEKDSFTVFPAGKTLTSYVIKTGVTQLVNKKRAEELEEQGLIESIGAPSESWLGLPLKMGKKIIGVFVIQSYDKDIIYTKDDVQVLEFVSDQIALAIERKRDHDNLIATQARHASIIESSPDGLIVIEPDGIIREHNSSILEMLNIEAETITNRNFFDFVTPGNVDKIKLALDQTVKSGFRKNVETRIIRDDGTNFFAETSFGLISDKSRQINSFVIIIKNISERKNYEANLKIAKNKAEESDRLKTAFLSNMSHEIRTPMNAIIGFAELLSSREVSKQEKIEFTEQINHGAETLMRLIDDIIDISKIEAGQLIINNTNFNLSHLMRDLYQIFSKSLYNQDKNHIKLIEDNNNRDLNIMVYTDQLRLKQIFSNLLSNAVKFTESGEIRFGVKNIYNERISFYVRDTGVGIEKKKLKLIFERFRQGHELDGKFYSGTGLGLPISKNLTELMGGKISVNSIPGKGTEFNFTIPYKRATSRKFN